MDMEHDWKAARIEAARVELVARDDMSRRCAALEALLRYEVEQREAAAERNRKMIVDLMIQRREAIDRAIAATARADTSERELKLAMDRLQHILCCDGNMALAEWSDRLDCWLDMRDGMSFGELLHQIDDDRLSTERQARDAWEARQADEIAQIAARNAARMAA